MEVQRSERLLPLYRRAQRCAREGWEVKGKWGGVPDTERIWPTLLEAVNGLPYSLPQGE
jgi:hypothetical protein